MLRSLRNTVFQVGRNINGDYHPKTHFLCCLQNPTFLLQNKPISSISSTTSSSSSSSFVVSYLMNSCGLSEHQALSTSKKIHFETTSRPDSVLSLLETHGFTKPHISKLITSCPALLLSDPNKTLKPKLDFLNSLGLPGLDLVKVLSKAPDVLQRSLENQIMPNFALLKNIVHTERNVIAALKRSSCVLYRVKKMVPNIEHLRDQGVPESNITKLLITQPRALAVDAVRFKEIVEEIKGIGIDPSLRTFVFAIHGFTAMSKSTWEAKLDVYRRWGWSEDEILLAFRKQPCCMMGSEKKIMSIMDFLVNQMGNDSSLMAKHPSILLYSLEKRIIPRCLVLKVLVSKGLIKKVFKLGAILRMVEKSFMEKYVIKYEEEVPEVLKAFQGQLDCLKLPINSEGVDGLKML